MLRTIEHIVDEIQCDRESGYSSEESNINSVLPNEIFIHYILKYLDLKGLYSALFTCKKWNNHVRSYFSTKGDSYVFAIFIADLLNIILHYSEVVASKLHFGNWW